MKLMVVEKTNIMSSPFLLIMDKKSCYHGLLVIILKNVLGSSQIPMA